MRFVPDHQLAVAAEENYPAAMAAIVQALSPCMHTGYIDTSDGLRLYYEYFLAQDAVASVVIVHGLSEFTKKFYETAHILLRQGYNVFIYDQRGHGLSDRETDQLDLLHVDDFNRYAEDLHTFMEQVVLPTEDKPVYLFSHSMGGAATLLYLAEHGDRVQKAILSVPLFRPTVGKVHPVVARWGVRVGRWVCGSKKKFWLSSEFNPEAPYRTDGDGSRARFEYNLKMRRENPQYQTTPMSYGWVDSALRIQRRLLSRKTVRAIDTPVLLLQAQQDRVVCLKPQRQFAAKCPTCRLIRYEECGHALLTTSNETLRRILNDILSFLKEA